MRFQDLFHSPSGVLFAFPSRYWFTIGRSRVFSLGGWSPHLQTGFHVSRPTCRALSTTARFSCTGLSPATASLSRLVPLTHAAIAHKADPISLATTFGISVDFFSCSYLDVSVRCVRLADLCIQPTIPPQREGGFPHSDICGSMLACQLPAAYRRLQRPSSPVIAKASTTCT